jgi:tripartite-type tricarboxylate transporter receptor subunit TctC
VGANHRWHGARAWCCNPQTDIARTRSADHCVGLDGFEVIGWNGIVAPAGTPAAIVSKLNAAIQHGIADPQLKPQLNTAGYDVAQPNTPEQFAKFINDDTERWSSVVQKANISVK